jgi:hypothetical protein
VPGTELGTELPVPLPVPGTGFRVEAGAHYPSDVIVGMAIGDFFGAMFDDAFLGDGFSDHLALVIVPVPGGGEFVWQLRF